VTNDFKQFPVWAALFARLFDTSPAQVALLDLDGVILRTNKAWLEFGRLHGLRPDYQSIGQNYLKICEQAADQGDPSATQAYIGLLEVFRTQRPKFTMVYPCHSPSQKQWYRMWVEPQSPQLPAIVVAHYVYAEDQPRSDTEPASFGANFLKTTGNF
jgi:hypothetical protein